MEKKSQNKKGGVKAIDSVIAELLSKKEFTKQIASNVVKYLTSERAEMYLESKSEVWQRELKKKGVRLAKECNIERIIEMFPLENEEIRQLVQNIKTKKESKVLNYDLLRKYIIEVLGDNILKERKSDMMRKKTPEIYTEPKEKITGESLQRNLEIEKAYRAVKCSYKFYCNLISTYVSIIKCPKEFVKVCLLPHAQSQVCKEEYTCGEYYFCGLSFARNPREIPEYDKCPGFFDPLPIL